MSPPYVGQTTAGLEECHDKKVPTRPAVNLDWSEGGGGQSHRHHHDDDDDDGDEGQDDITRPSPVSSGSVPVWW